MQQAGRSNKGERAEMGLHPSIRSLLAANAGFTTGNVPTGADPCIPHPHLSPRLSSGELNNSSQHRTGSNQPLCLDQGFCLAFCFPSRPYFEDPCHLPSPFPGTLSLGWLNRLLSNTCAVDQIAQDLGVGASALGLINIQRFI